MEGRTWQRGNSKTRGNSNSRQLSQPNDNIELDPMMSSLQKSHIASIISNARSTVGQNNEISRPFTPGDLPRHLFSGNDYDNRPGSSYKMKNVVGQAIDEFTSAVGNQSFATSATSQSSQSKIQIQRKGSKTGQDILNVLQKHDMTKPRGNQLAPIHKDAIKPLGAILNKPNIKGFDTGKPIKVIQKNQDQSSSSDQLQQQVPPTDKAPKFVKLKKPTNSEQTQERQEQKKEEQSQKEQFIDLINQNESQRIEELQRFDQTKMDNLTKIQQLQQQIKQANQQKNYIEEVDEDEYQDYFESEMLKDMEGVESFEHQIDYSQALENITQQTQNINQDMEDRDPEDDLEQEYLTQNLEEPEGYEAEFQNVIQEMGRVIAIIKSGDKSSIKEDDMLELSPRIWTLATEHEKQSSVIQSKCFLETLLKGSFCLLAIEQPRSILRFSACNIHLFLKIFDSYQKTVQANQPNSDFAKLFKNYLYETMKSLLLQAKEGTQDVLFKEENLIPQLGRVIHVCFLEKADLIMTLTSQKVNDKLIHSDDLYDLINYTIGSIKCFTQSNQDVQSECVKQRYIMMLSKCIQKALVFGNNPSKQSQILVQMCGALRNLVNDDNSYQQVCANSIIPKLIEILEKFKGHKELMLNVSRILSKISMDADCSVEIIKTNKLSFMVEMIQEYHQFTSFLIRIAFILANLTTYFDEARDQILQYKDGFKKILQVSIIYLQKDEPGENDKAKEKLNSGNLGSVEDSLVKLIRLVANLCTEDISDKLASHKELVDQYLDNMTQAISRKTIQDNEEFMFNAISCATNLLFYDTPNTSVFSDDLREKIFNSLKYLILQTQNEEIQIEAVRVLSNLSRHQSMCEAFVSDKTFLEALIVVLDHTLRDLVFYDIGIIINITLHEAIRPKLLDKNLIPKLIDVLKDANIEDMDLSRVAAKALHNVVGERNYWNIELIKRMDEILTSLGEELDSIMDVASEDDLVEIKSLRDMVNALINDMPEPMFDCPDKACGRKFKNKDELDKHVERRHGQKK